MPDATVSWHAGHYRRTTPKTHPRGWKAFSQHDPYNNDNLLEGFIQVSGGNEYGKLVIHTVNGNPAPQEIFATPKASYPFDRQGHWILSGQEHIQAYEKLDGTNIFQFVYIDDLGNRFISFKTRMRAGLSERFQILVNEVLEKESGIRNANLGYGEGVGYELTGYKNPHSIRYPYPIQMHALYGRWHGSLFGIHDDPKFFKRLGCPVVQLRHWEETDTELEYRKRQKVYASNISEVSPGEEFFDGTEGDVLYATFPNGTREKLGSFTRLIKLKNPIIEQIHWRSDRVAIREITATARNLWEVDDHPTIDDLKMLLAEDWTDLQIDKSLATINQVYTSVIEERNWENCVLDIFNEVSSVNQWVEAPGDSMRAIAKTGEYDRNKMTKVFGVLRKRV